MPHFEICYEKEKEKGREKEKAKVKEKEKEKERVLSVPRCPKSWNGPKRNIQVDINFNISTAEISEITLKMKSAYLMNLDGWIMT